MWNWQEWRPELLDPEAQMRSWVQFQRQHISWFLLFICQLQNVSKSRWCEIGQLFYWAKSHLAQKSNLVEEVTWRSKKYIKLCLKIYQLWGCRPNIIVIFHLKNIFQLMLYWDIPTFKLCLQGKFLFRNTEEKLGQSCVLFLPFLLQWKAITWAGWFWNRTHRQARSSDAPLKLLYFQNWAAEKLWSR